MKRFVTTIGALLLGLTCARAQVNVVPQVGQVSNYITRQTYSAGFVGLVPAASATDVVCIAGSATKTIRVMRIRISGTAGTLVTVPISFIRRASVDTGGTAASTTANPNNQITKRDTLNGTATATLISYTANPTINDTSGTIFASTNLTLPTTAAATSINPLDYPYVGNIASLAQAPTLRGTSQQFCVNFNATSVTSGLLTGAITWTEE